MPNPKFAVASLLPNQSPPLHSKRLSCSPDASLASTSRSTAVPLHPDPKPRPPTEPPKPARSLHLLSSNPKRHEVSTSPPPPPNPEASTVPPPPLGSNPKPESEASSLHLSPVPPPLGSNPKPEASSLHLSPEASTEASLHLSTETPKNRNSQN